MKEVWKLQRPLASNLAANAEFPQILAYTKDKAKVAFVPIIAEDLYFLFGEQDKIYVRAEIDKQGVLTIDDYIEDRSLEF